MSFLFALKCAWRGARLYYVAARMFGGTGEEAVVAGMRARAEAVWEAQGGLNLLRQALAGYDAQAERTPGLAEQLWFMENRADVLTTLEHSERKVERLQLGFHDALEIALRLGHGAAVKDIKIRR